MPRREKRAHHRVALDEESGGVPASATVDDNTGEARARASASCSTTTVTLSLLGVGSVCGLVAIGIVTLDEELTLPFSSSPPPSPSSSAKSTMSEWLMAQAQHLKQVPPPSPISPSPQPPLLPPLPLFPPLSPPPSAPPAPQPPPSPSPPPPTPSPPPLQPPLPAAPPPAHPIPISQIVAGLNDRFERGEPSNDLAAAGVIVRQFDDLDASAGMSSSGAPWQPCPSSAWCHVYADRWPTSIVNTEQRHLFFERGSRFGVGPKTSPSTGTVGGIIMDPRKVEILCAYPQDGNRCACAACNIPDAMSDLLGAPNRPGLNDCQCRPVCV